MGAVGACCTLRERDADVDPIPALPEGDEISSAGSRSVHWNGTSLEPLDAQHEELLLSESAPSTLLRPKVVGNPNAEIGCHYSTLTPVPSMTDISGQAQRCKIWSKDNLDDAPPHMNSQMSLNDWYGDKPVRTLTKWYVDEDVDLSFCELRNVGAA